MRLKKSVSTFYLSALIGIACGGSTPATGAGGKGGSAGVSGGTSGKAGGTAGTTGAAGGTAGASGAAGGTAGASGAAGGTAGASGAAGGTAGASGAGGNGGSAGGSPATPILGSLNTITTIGSTIDPNNNLAIDPTGSGTNPYGLVIAPVSAGLITAGDLVVCNFNNGPNVVQGSPAPNTQGQGTTVVGLHPVPSANAGGNPYHIAQSASLLGCSSLSMFIDDSIAATAFSAGIVPLVAPSGSVSSPFAADNLAKPWGSAYVAAANGQPAALYVSTATGSINRITLDNGTAATLRPPSRKSSRAFASPELSKAVRIRYTPRPA